MSKRNMDHSDHHTPFDKQMQELLNSYSPTPSSRVWDGIEQKMAVEEADKLKQKVILYRNVAAAAILVALLSVGFNFYTNSSIGSSRNPEQTLAENQTASTALTEQSMAMNAPSEEGGAQSSKTTSRQGAALNMKEELLARIQKRYSTSPAKWVQLSSAELKAVETTPDHQSWTNPGKAIAYQHALSPEKNGKVLTLKRSYLKQISNYNWHQDGALAANQETKPKPEEAWAGVQMAAGTFDPHISLNQSGAVASADIQNSVVYQPGTSARPAANRNLLQQVNIDQKQKPARSYSFGVGYGFALSKRWSVRSGLRYTTYQSNGSSNAILRNQNDTKVYPLLRGTATTQQLNDKVVNVTSDYKVYNQFKMLTIPVVMGFKLIDKKISFSLIGGLSTDIFLNNTIEGSSEVIQNVSLSAKDNQVYRSWYFSSVAGVEVAWHFLPHCSLNLQPTYNSALQSFTRQESGFSGLPSALNMGVSLNYQLN